MSSHQKTVLCRDNHNNWSCIPVTKLSDFRPSVYGVIVRNGKVLLSKQWDGYDFPGGGIDLGETIDHALVREVHEETGLRVKPGELVAVHDSFFDYRSKKKYTQSILIYYTCRVTSGRLSTSHLTSGEQKYVGLAEWVDLKKVSKLKFYNPIDSPALIRNVMSRSRSR